MEMNKKEVVALENVVSKALDSDVRELSEFQLALIGGGNADPILY